MFHDSSDRTWYQKVIQLVLDVILGRRYWRNRALQFEQEQLRVTLYYELVQENERLRTRVHKLDTVCCDQFFTLYRLERELKPIVEKLKG